MNNDQISTNLQYSQYNHNSIHVDSFSSMQQYKPTKVHRTNIDVGCLLSDEMDLFEMIQLYSLPMSELTLFQQLQQVQAHQLRMVKYHKIYTKSLNDEFQQNEFLSLPNQPIQQSFYDQSEELPLFESKKQVKESEECQIYQSHIVNAKEEIRLSRIFEDIVLVDQNNSGYNDLFDVQIEIDGVTIPISTSKNKDQHYSLSNFSSFNNCMSKPQQAIEFKQLLEHIQQTTGKILTKESINRIIAQISQYSQKIKEQLQRQQNKQTTKKPQFSLIQDSYFEMPEPSKHKFDTILNNCPFQKHKNKGKHFQSTKSQKNTFVNRSLFQMGRNLKESQEQTQKRHSNSRTFIRNSNRQEKENRRQKIQNKELALKTVRIFGKGGRQMILNYLEPKQIEHFCIVNKIFGKEKDKLMRAIQANKSIIHLE